MQETILTCHYKTFNNIFSFSYPVRILITLISLLNTILQEILDNRARTYAVLNYQGMDENRIPIIRQRECTSTVPCLAVNQVFG